MGSGIGRKIFITGGTGFVGSSFIESFKSDIGKLLVLVRPSSNVTWENKENIGIVFGDITKPETYCNYLKDVDVIIHLASIVTDWAPQKEYYMVNLEGTRKLLECAIHARVKAFIHISTVGVMYRGKQKMILNDNMGYIVSKSHYNRTKILAEQLVLEANRNREIEAVVIRPAWIYGPRDKTLMPEIIYQILNRGTVPLIGDENTFIPLIYIKNFINILRCIVENYSDFDGKVIIAADKEQVTWHQFIKIVAVELGKKVKFIYIPYWVAYVFGLFFEVIGKTMNLKKRPTITRASVDIMSASIRVDPLVLENIPNYSQEISLIEGIKKTLLYFRNVDPKKLRFK